MLDARSNFSEKSERNNDQQPNLLPEFEPLSPQGGRNSGNGKADGQSDTTQTVSGQDPALKHLADLQIDYDSLTLTIDSFFEKADADKDGFVNADELEKSKDNTDIKDGEAVVRDLLDKGLPIVQLLSNDEWGKEDSGATREDVGQAFKTWMDHTHAMDEAYRVGEYVPDNFGAWDVDKNGYLSKDELDYPDIPNSTFAKELFIAFAADTMHRKFDDVMRANKDGAYDSKGISVQDVKNYYDKVKAETDPNTAFLNQIFNDIAVSLEGK